MSSAKSEDREEVRKAEETRHGIDVPEMVLEGLESGNACDSCRALGAQLH